jgi:hypothetical protein
LHTRSNLFNRGIFFEIEDIIYMHITMASPKNVLQEYCHKMHISAPVYDTKRINAVTEIPLFESILAFQGGIFRATGTTKINAEKEVARNICEKFVHMQPHRTTTIAQKLCQKYVHITSIFDEEYDQVYLIDGDNCHITDETIFADRKKLFIYFVAKNTTRPIPSRHQTQYENCCLFISNSIGHDAVDHLLSFTLGQICSSWHNMEYFIVTRDHFGECLQTFAPRCKLLCQL